MKGFNFEKNLDHQTRAVESTVSVFDDLHLVQPLEVDKNFINAEFDFLNSRSYPANLRKVIDDNGITEPLNRKSNILDIQMETGTGKTYTYTKTIFELNKLHGIFKFIVVVPTLSIKAGTVDFLKSESTREHFKEQYGKTVQLHIVESQKNSRNKKSFIPPAVGSFVNAGRFEKNNIQILIINAGMINSDTMQKSFDKGLMDKYTVPFEAIGATRPFLIIDEPHKFAKSNKTWENILKMRPQFILRYGATFQGFENLVYRLTAVDSFNRNLVKGVIGHITEFESGKNAIVKFIDSDGKEARFDVTEIKKGKEDNKDKKDENKIKLSRKESMAKVHPAMTDLTIEKLNKSTVVLSNGLELKKGDKLNPYSYAETLQETMIQKAIKSHFELEKALLTREVKIKPLTLFFIDNIEEYRNKEGYIRRTIEQYINAEVKEILRTEKDGFYKNYLEKTLIDLSKTHAGYFSKDNTEKDDAIEKELNEILHDKQSMLDLDNVRRFIFSKWTLREGWDNPNVFQICKIRSSGSEISKLQEVGRGLRLPVNEYGNRVKDEQFYLNYFVDFTENDFVDKLVMEINESSGAISIEETPEKLTEQMIKQILDKYPDFDNDSEKLLEFLDNENIIKRNNDFKEGGYSFIKTNYPLIFEGINSSKVRKSVDTKKKISVRTEKYQELKALWEKLNEKVILEYKFENEHEFKKLFKDFFKSLSEKFKTIDINEKISRVEFEDNRAVVKEPESIYSRQKSKISVMKYSEFLKELAKIININIKTLHNAIIESRIDVNSYLNMSTLRELKQNFNYFLMANAFDKFSIEYKKVSNSIHPTKFTDEKGRVLNEVSSSDIGTMFSDENVAKSYLLNELYYDSELEKNNIQNEIEEVVVFTKIPKNSIKIPVAGDKSYTPDFAYVIKFPNNVKVLHFIVETKDVNGEDRLREEERFKIKHAEKFFGGKVKLHFSTQFTNDKITELIKEIADV
jgi:type III restriction enzyme